jgi:hypothetical protein
VQTYQVGLLGLLVFGIFVAIAFLTWRSKGIKQARYIEAPLFIDSNPEGIQGFYVATTFGGRPLDRVVAHGLAHRGMAFVQARADGLAIYRRGESSFLIPKAAIIGASRTSAVIDRAVEKDGLVSVKWRLGTEELETHFRFVGASDRQAILSDLDELVGV